MLTDYLAQCRLCDLVDGGVDVLDGDHRFHRVHDAKVGDGGDVDADVSRVMMPVSSRRGYEVWSVVSPTGWGSSRVCAAAINLSELSLCSFSWSREAAASPRWIVACCCRRHARTMLQAARPDHIDVDLDLGRCMGPCIELVGKHFLTPKS